MKGIALFLLMLVAAFAGAADDFDVHCSNIAILQDKRVQKEVGITTAQHDKLTKLADAHTARLKAYQAQLAGKQPDMNVIGGYLNDLKKNVIAILSASQVKRLRELNLQAAGLLGLMDAVVAKRVGIGQTQLQNMQKTYAAGRDSAQKLLQSAMQPLDQKYEKLAQPYKGHEKEHDKELRALGQQYAKEAQAAQLKVKPRITAITQSTEKKMMAMLTPQQKATWTALQGKKFVPK